MKEVRVKIKVDDEEYFPSLSVVGEKFNCRNLFPKGFHIEQIPFEGLV